MSHYHTSFNSYITAAVTNRPVLTFPNVLFWKFFNLDTWYTSLMSGKSHQNLSENFHKKSHPCCRMKLGQEMAPFISALNSELTFKIGHHAYCLMVYEVN